MPIQPFRWVERIVGEYVRGKRTTGTSYWDTGQKQYEGQWLTKNLSSSMHGEGTFYRARHQGVHLHVFKTCPKDRLPHKDGETPTTTGSGDWQVARRGQPLQSKWIPATRASLGMDRIRICLEPGEDLAGATPTRGDSATKRVRQTCRQTRELVCK